VGDKGAEVHVVKEDDEDAQGSTELFVIGEDDDEHLQDLGIGARSKAEQVGSESMGLATMKREGEDRG
jgi:hypothetical protein